MKVKSVKIKGANADFKNVEFKPSAHWTEIITEVAGKGQIRMYFSPDGQKVAEAE